MQYRQDHDDDDRIIKIIRRLLIYTVARFTITLSIIIAPILHMHSRRLLERTQS